MAITKTRGKKNLQIEEIKAKDLLSTTAPINFSAVNAALTKTRTELQQAMSSITTSLEASVQQKETLEQAIQLKTQELERLNQIQVSATTLDDLKAEIEATREELQTLRSDWNQEQADLAQAVAREKNRQQEEDKYNRQIRERQLTDDFNAKMAQLARMNQEKQEQLERGWKDREETLKGREQELVDLTQEVNSFEARLTEARTQAAQEAVNAYKVKFENQIALMSKEAEAERRVLNAQITGYQTQIKELSGRLTSLEEALNQARQDVKEISAQAVQSASNRTLSDTLTRVLENTTQPQTSGKSSK